MVVVGNLNLRRVVHCCLKYLEVILLTHVLGVRGWYVPVDDDALEEHLAKLES